MKTNTEMCHTETDRRSFEKISLLVLLCLGIGTCDDPIVVLQEIETPTITTSERLPDAVKGEAYSTQLAATGGDGNYTWTILSGDLPDGLTLSVSGKISGEPTEADPDKSFSFTLGVTSAGRPAQKDFLLTVEYAALQILTTELKRGIIGM